MKTFLIAALVTTAALAAPALAQSHGGHDSHGSMMPAAATAEAAAVSGTGTLNSVKAAGRTVNVTHEPIPAIGWPAMTMDFAVADGVDLTKLQPGAKITFTLAKGADGIYMINGIKGK